MELENSTKSFSTIEKSVALAIGIVTISIFYITSVRQNKKTKGKKFLNRLAPHVKWTPFRLPLIDGFITIILLRLQGIKVLEKFPLRFGKAFNIELAHFKFFVHLDPVVIQRVLSSSLPAHVGKPYLARLIVTDLLKDGLVTSEPHVWMRHRKALQPAFTNKTYPTYLKLIEDSVQSLISAACNESQNMSSKSKTLSSETMNPLIYQTTVEIIKKIILGSNNAEIPDAAQQQFYEDFRNVKDLAVERFLYPHQLLEPIWMIHPNKEKLERGVESVKSFSNLIISKYRKEAEERQSKELLDINTTEDDCGIKPFLCLVEHMIKSELTNKEIIDQICTFLVAGHETSAVTLEYVCFFIAKHPQIQAKCQEEIDELWKGKEGGQAFTMKDLASMQYLERCILETLRIAPTFRIYLRSLEAPVELDNEYVIEGGSQFAIIPWLVHRNPEIYPEPEKFEPDRFLPENVKQRHPYSFLPFSMGPRNCIGYRVAQIEMKIVMMYLLRYFSFSTDDDLGDVKILFDITLKPERKFSVKYHQRSVAVFDDKNE